MILLLNNDGPKREKGATEEDKKELNGIYEMGLTDLYPWANKGRARLTQRSIMDRHYEKLRWNPNINRILAQRGFQKIRALMKTFSIRKRLVHHV